MYQFNTLKNILSTIILFISMSGILQAASISVGDINQFINGGSTNGLQKLIADTIANELKNNGISSTPNGLQLYSGSLSSNDRGCVLTQHAALLGYSILVKNSSNILFDNSNISSLNDDIELHLLLDLSANVNGYINFTPKDYSNTLRICFSISPDTIRINPNVYIYPGLVSSIKLQLNPRYINSYQSVSGKPEISFTPTAVLTSKMNALDGSINPNLDANIVEGLIDMGYDLYTAYNIITTITSSAKVEPLTAVISTAIEYVVIKELKRLANSADEQIKQKATELIQSSFNKTLDSIKNSYSNPYIHDLTNKIPAIQNLILPSEVELIASVLPKLLAANGAAPIVGMDAAANPGQALYDFLTNNKVNIDKHISQANQAQTAALQAILGLLKD